MIPAPAMVGRIGRRGHAVRERGGRPRAHARRRDRSAAQCPRTTSRPAATSPVRVDPTPFDRRSQDRRRATGVASVTATTPGYVDRYGQGLRVIGPSLVAPLVVAVDKAVRIRRLRRTARALPRPPAPGSRGRRHSAPHGDSCSGRAGSPRVVNDRSDPAVRSCGRVRRNGRGRRSGGAEPRVVPRRRSTTTELAAVDRVPRATRQRSDRRRAAPRPASAAFRLRGGGGR
jgi:hypothetical protein